MKFDFKIILATAILFFANSSIANVTDENNASESVSTDISGLVSTVEKTHRAYGVDLNLSFMPITPQIYADKNLNNEKFSLRGPSINLIKGFNITEDIFTISNLGGVFMFDTAQGEISHNKVSFVNVQFVQQFGLNILSWNIDQATLHPFIGVGGYISNLRNQYDSNSSFYQIANSGITSELGLLLINQPTGMYLTLKGSMFSPLDSERTSSANLTASQSLADTAKISNKIPLMISLGFGMKFK